VRTETFQTPGDVRLEIRLGAGEVRLETADVQETTVVLEPLRDNDATAAAITNARLELSERGEGSDVLIDVRDRGRGLSGIFRGAEVLVSVTCPDGTSAEARTGSADVVGRGRFGAVEVETGSGDVEFSEIAGEARVNAASGDVQLGEVGGDLRINTASGDVQLKVVGGDAKINTASGDVIIREVGGELSVNTASGDVLVREARSSVSVNTASGDVEFGRVVGGNVTLKSASGDLKVGIPEGTNLFVDARSRSGDVRSELPVSDLPPEGDGQEVELSANTMSGDITVSRA
jgi:putative adhesin